MILIKKYPIRFRRATVSNTSYINGLKQLCNIDKDHENIINNLMYATQVMYDPLMITSTLSILYKYKPLVKINTLKQQREVIDLNLDKVLTDKFTSILVFLCMSLCSCDAKITHCKQIMELVAIKPNFNLLLYGFNVMACPNFEYKYTFKNTFYHPITLQCCMKIDYLYKNLQKSTEYNNLILDKDSTITHNQSEQNEENEQIETSFDPLFTIPEKNVDKDNVKENYSSTRPINLHFETKIIILKKVVNYKDKGLYNISKI